MHLAAIKKLLFSLDYNIFQYKNNEIIYIEFSHRFICIEKHSLQLAMTKNLVLSTYSIPQ